MSSTRNTIVIIACLGLVFLGCEPQQAVKPKSSNVMTQPAGHDSHDHGHHHGPRGGEMFHFEDAGLSGEWVAKYDQNLIQFYILDEDEKTEKKIKADKLVASFTAKELMTFEIPASAADEDGASSQFELQDEQLALAMKTTGVDLEVEVDGKTYKVYLPKDPHASH